MNKVSIIVAVLFLIIFIPIWYYFPNYINDKLTIGTIQPIVQTERWARNGTFGDTYGALNALLSIFTTAGLIYTLIIQQIQLNLQNKEFASQREALELQNMEMLSTRKEFQINRITTIIYSQIEKFEEAVKLFEIKVEGEKLKGNDAFLHLQNFVENFIVISAIPLSQKSTLTAASKVVSEEIEAAYKLKRISEVLLRTEVAAKNNADAMRIFYENSKSISEFALKAHNITAVIKALFLHSDLKASELNNMQLLFSKNLGLTYTFILNFIQLRLKEQPELSKLFPKYFTKHSMSQFVNFEYHASTFNRFITDPINESNFMDHAVSWDIELTP